MVPHLRLSLLSLALAPAVFAHFQVNVPTPWNGNIDNEDTSPCGAATPSTTSSDFHVGGDAIGLTSLHAQCFLAYRGILGNDPTSSNWTVLIPTVEEFGLNGFCEPSIAVPASWAGSAGLLQIIQHAEDGVHYQVRGFQSLQLDSLESPLANNPLSSACLLILLLAKAPLCHQLVPTLLACLLHLAVIVPSHPSRADRHPSFRNLVVRHKEVHPRPAHYQPPRRNLKAPPLPLGAPG
jgi:hypothetical protein